MRRVPFLAGLCLAMTFGAAAFASPGPSVLAPRASASEPASVEPTPAAAGSLDQALSSISAANIRADIFFIASDELEGRDTPSPGQRIAARFIRSRLQRLGFQPGAPAGYLFEYPLYLPRIDAAKTTASFKRGGASESWALGSDYYFAARDLCDLDLEGDFDAARSRLAKVDESAAKTLGVLVSRPRFVVRCVNGLEMKYAEHFADVFDAVLSAYDEVFGFAEFSKTPGKKLRVYVHREESIERPPHFAPQFPYHSQIDFPVVDAERLASPTPDGKFLFYGLCHELGHVVAMWGDPQHEADHHTWAHYTGVAIVEHLSQDSKRSKLLADLKDVKWRSLATERETCKATTPDVGARDGTMALWIALHDELGPRAIGDAINALDRADKRRRVNRVRYYTFDELKGALANAAKDDKKRKRLKQLLP